MVKTFKRMKGPRGSCPCYPLPPPPPPPSQWPCLEKVTKLKSLENAVHTGVTLKHLNLAVSVN